MNESALIIVAVKRLKKKLGLRLIMNIIMLLVDTRWAPRGGRAWGVR